MDDTKATNKVRNHHLNTQHQHHHHHHLVYDSEDAHENEIFSSRKENYIRDDDDDDNTDEDTTTFVRNKTATPNSNSSYTHSNLPYLIGIGFIIIVSLLWSASSILVQYLNITYQFESPFLVTYLGVSLFVILLPIGCIYHPPPTYYHHTHPTGGSDCSSATFTRFTSSTNTNDTNDDDEYTPDIVSTTASSTIKDTTNTVVVFLTHKQHMMIAGQIAPSWFVANYFYNKSLLLTSITSSTILASTGSVFTFLFSVFFAKTETWTPWKCIGVFFAFVGSCWTSLVDLFFYPEEPSSLSLVSSFSSSSSFTHSYFWGDLTGLIAAIGYGVYTVLLSFLCPKDESTMSMNLLLGYMGLFQMIFWSPGLLFILVSTTASSSSNYSMNTTTNSSSTSSPEVDILRLLQQDTQKALSEKHDRITWPILTYLIIKGLTDNVLSDYLWARAVLLTSATVATVGLGLTIPLAFLSDAILSPLLMNPSTHDDDDMSLNHTSTTTLGQQQQQQQQAMHRDLTIHHILGALFVLVGFILVNIGHERKLDMAHPTEETVIERETENGNDREVECHYPD